MKGSMTVEAVFVMSVLLLVFLWVMKMAIGLYQQTVETAMVEWLDAQEAVALFRDIFYFIENIPSIK